MPRTREQELPSLSRADLLGGENQAIQRLIGAQAQTYLANVHVADMDPNPFNPRQAIEVSELVESMREHGFIGALDGRLQGRRVQLAYGARRLAAAKIAGIEQIPVYLHADWDDNILLTISLVENVQREDLAPLETALTVQQMNERLGWSQRDIARRTGKSHSWVRDMIALAAAGSDVQALVRERPDAARHARFIAQVEDETVRQALAQAARRDDLTADQVYRAVQAVKSGQTAPQALRSVTRRSPAPRLADPHAAPAAGQPAADQAAVQPPVAAAQEGVPEQNSSKALAPATLPLETPSETPEGPLQALQAAHAYLIRLNLDTLRQEALADPVALQAAVQAIRAALAHIEAALHPVSEAPSTPS